MCVSVMDARTDRWQRNFNVELHEKETKSVTATMGFGEYDGHGRKTRRSDMVRQLGLR